VRYCRKIAAWTLGEPHSVHLTVSHRAGNPEEIVLEPGHLPNYVGLLKGDQLK
jgi:hypothetical protein